MKSHPRKFGGAWGFKDILEKRAAIDSAAGRLLRGRHHRIEDYRRDGRGVLHAPRSAQPAGPMLIGGQPPGRGLNPQLPHSGTRRQRVHRPAGEAAAAHRERASPAADRAGARHHDRREQAHAQVGEPRPVQSAVRHRRRFGD